MKVSYYPDTDSLYIDLSEKPSAESREISEGVILDYDSEGNLVGIDIDNAGKKVNLKELTLSREPAEIRTVAAQLSALVEGLMCQSGILPIGRLSAEFPMPAPR